MKVVTGFEMQALDKKVIEGIGVPAEVLMERAGLGVAENIKKYYPPEFYQRVIILCGPGNNGGDGMVCARHLKDFGYKVFVLLLADKDRYKGEALINLNILKKLNFPTFRISSVEELQNLLKLEKPHILVDALFGTGLKRPIEGFYKEVIEKINEYKEKESAKIVSVDISSGVCSNTGQILGIAVKADLTVTFELIKIGHISYPGKAYTGKLEIVPIGFPKDIIEKESKRDYIDWEWAKKVFKPRVGYTHKGTFGHVLILGGSRGKSGAGLLAALGALKGGAGLVTLASTISLQKIYCSILPEILTLGLPENSYGEVSFESLEEILNACKRKSVLVIGPGLGLSEEMKKLFFTLLEKLDIPVVIDADGLTLLSENPSVLKNYKIPKVLTPHPGEASRLLKISKDEILKDRLKIAKELANLTDSIVVLKGPHTIISSPDNEAISSIDEPGLSQGGTGDVLSGLIGAFIAQKYPPFLATALAVFLHGEAGKYLSKEKGPFGYTATEVANAVPLILKKLSS